MRAFFNGSCDEAREHLSEHLEGELRGWQRFRIGRHIRRCDRCREVVQSLARAVDQLTSLRGTGPAIPSVAAAVVERVGRI